MIKTRVLAALAAIAAAAPALAQTYPTGVPYERAPGHVSLQCNDAVTACTPPTTANPLPVAIISGGGGGGGGTEYTEDAVAPANPVGGIAQARRKDTLSASEVSADGDVITLNATSKGQLHVYSDLGTVSGTAIAAGAGAVTAGSLRVTQASDSPLVAATGAIGDSAWASGNGTLVALLKAVATAANDTTTPSPVKIDQTTVGTTNAVSLAQIGATTVSTGNGTAGTGVQRVTIASDNSAFSVVATQAITNSTTGDTGAKTATGNGATQTNAGNKGVQVLLQLGTVSGTSPTMVLKLQGSVDGGTTFYDIPAATTASLTATGNFGITVYPGVTAVTGTTTSGTTAAAAQTLPRTWRAVWTIGGTTPSFTITSIQYNYLPN